MRRERVKKWRNVVPPLAWRFATAKNTSRRVPLRRVFAFEHDVFVRISRVRRK